MVALCSALPFIKKNMHLKDAHMLHKWKSDAAVLVLSLFEIKSVLFATWGKPEPRSPENLLGS